MFNKVQFTTDLSKALKECGNSYQQKGKTNRERFVSEVAEKIFDTNAIYMTQSEGQRTCDNIAGLMDNIVSLSIKETITLIFLAAITLVLAGLNLGGKIPSNFFMYGALGSVVLGLIIHGYCQNEKYFYSEKVIDTLSEILIPQEEANQEVDLTRNGRDSDVEDANESDVAEIESE